MDSVVRKSAVEARLFGISFSERMPTTDSITAVLSVTPTPAGLSALGAPTFNAQEARQYFSGGTAGTAYQILFVVSTLLGSVLQGKGFLVVTS